MEEMSLGTIVRMSDSEIMHLARTSKIENASGGGKIKAYFVTRIRNMDLSEVEVVEAISTHLVKRPVAEAAFIVSTIDTDIKKAREFINKLDEIQLKIDPTVSDDCISVVLSQMSQDIRQRAAELAINPKSKGSLSISYSLDNLVDRFNVYGNLASLEHDIRFIVVSNTRAYLNSIGEQKTLEELIEMARKYVTDEWTHINSQLNKTMFGVGSKHPVITKLYDKHADEIKILKSRLETLVGDLRVQKTKTEAIIAPIQEMAKDLRSYLQVADDIRSIREATAFLGALEIRNDERGHAIAMLVHYSETSLAALSEVKNTLDSYQSATSELSIDNMQQRVLTNGNSPQEN